MDMRRGALVPPLVTLKMSDANAIQETACSFASEAQALAAAATAAQLIYSLQDTLTSGNLPQPMSTNNLLPQPLTSDNLPETLKQESSSVPPSAILAASANGHTHVLRVLLAPGSSPSVLSDAIIFASAFGHARALDLLLSTYDHADRANALSNAFFTGTLRDAALTAHVACLQGQNDSVECLMQRHAEALTDALVRTGMALARGEGHGHTESLLMASSFCKISRAGRGPAPVALVV